MPRMMELFFFHRFILSGDLDSACSKSFSFPLRDDSIPYPNAKFFPPYCRASKKTTTPRFLESSSVVLVPLTTTLLFPMPPRSLREVSSLPRCYTLFCLSTSLFSLPSQAIRFPFRTDHPRSLALPFPSFSGKSSSPGNDPLFMHRFLLMAVLATADDSSICGIFPLSEFVSPLCVERSFSVGHNSLVDNALWCGYTRATPPPPRRLHFGPF